MLALRNTLKSIQNFRAREIESILTDTALIPVCAMAKLA